MPIRLVSTSGNKQYPNTDAERGNVSVDERCEEAGEWWSWMAEEGSVEADSGGDIRERMK